MKNVFCLIHAHVGLTSKIQNFKIMEQTIEKSRKLVDTQSHDFGVWDKSGRDVGANIEVRQLEVVSEEMTSGSYWAIDCPENGVIFTWTPNASRNGKDFGACQHPKVCTTREEVDAQIKKYLASAKKRAIKNFTNSGK